ncbi:PREDICTED: class I histocompatibility antigen, F10 alpha chain-like, partial [Pterocles gutturalis]|uniref:class I histocompatibility antigen, F10 alpha chain-like n=1 Tax=Pterocles gutturalis TaxID=240206 RepID=UPI000528F416
GLHSLRYFHIAVTEPSTGVPQFMSVGYVDGNLISCYDSDTGRAEPREDWMAASLGQEHWDRQTRIGQNNHQVYHVSLDIVRGRYNQSR